jgi:hypothetical protein
MNNNTIKNVSDPVNPKDVVNLQTLQQASGSSDLTSLTDTPNDYTGSDGKILVVDGVNTIFTDIIKPFIVFEGGASSSSGSTTKYGYMAAHNNIDGFGFVATGYRAATNNTTGSYFVADGYQAAWSNIDGDGFVSDGHLAASKNISGSDYIAIGRSAASRLNSALFATDFSNSVYIGANTRVSANGVTNENVFGYAADGKGSNTVAIGNSSITDNYLNGNTQSDNFTSIVATGTQPFATTSTTLNTNLNADLLDGVSSEGFAKLATTNTFTNTNRFNEIVILEKTLNTDTWMVFRQGVGNVSFRGRNDLFTIETTAFTADVNSFRIDLSNTTGNDSYLFGLTNATFDHDLIIDNLDSGGDDLVVRSPDGGLISIDNNSLLQKTKIDADGTITKYINDAKQGSITIEDNGVIELEANHTSYSFTETEALFQSPLWIGTESTRATIDKGVNTAKFSNIIASVETSSIELTASNAIIAIGGVEKVVVSDASVMVNVDLVSQRIIIGDATSPQFIRGDEGVVNKWYVGSGSGVGGTTDDLAIYSYLGETSLWHAGSKKLQTNSDGVDIIGNITAANFPASDRRIKSNISNISRTNVDLINFKQFNISKYSNTRMRYGAIAQEVELILPDLVYTMSDEMKTKGINYIDLLILEDAISRERV